MLVEFRNVGKERCTVQVQRKTPVDAQSRQNGFLSVVAGGGYKYYMIRLSHMFH